MKAFLSIIIFIFSLNLLAENANGASATESKVWLWQKNCQGLPIKCEVWFNAATAVSQIHIKQNNQLLGHQYKSYSSMESPSSMAVLVQNHGISDSQLSELKKALAAMFKPLKDFEKVGLFQFNPELKALAILGSSQQNIISQVEKITATTSLENNAKPVLDILRILGGASTERKVLLWMTSDINLTHGQQREIKAALLAENVRLVMVHLQLSELSANNSESLNQLASETSGLLLSLPESQWLEKLKQLAAYPSNGGIIQIESQSLCGDGHFQFVAEIGQSNITESWQTQLPACVEEHVSDSTSDAQEEQPNTETSEAPSSNNEEEADTPSTSETETTSRPSNDVEQNATDNPAGDQNGSSDAQSPSTSQSQQTDSSDNQTSQASESPTTQENTTESPPSSEAEQPAFEQWKIPMLVGLAVLFVLLFMVYIRRKASSNPKRVYAYLVEFKQAQEIRHELSQNAVIIGRNLDCNIVLDDDSVSGKHAVIKLLENHEVIILDTMSSNGLRVNQQKVSEIKLSDGDIIHFGDTKARFEWNQ